MCGEFYYFCCCPIGCPIRGAKLGNVYPEAPAAAARQCSASLLVNYLVRTEERGEFLHRVFTRKQLLICSKVV